MKGPVYGDDCTVRHLLDMSVGIRFDEDYMASDGDVINYRRSTGWAAAGRRHSADPSAPIPANAAAGRKAARPHVPLCVNEDPDVLGWVYERACGMSYAKILSQHLWNLMGAAA